MIDIEALISRLEDPNRRGWNDHELAAKAIRELSKNSARYLWLRDEMGITLDLGHGKLGNKVHPTQLDAAIDRAMGEWVP